MPNIWKRENQSMALDKKSDDTRFGSRSYTFLDSVIMEKGIGREKTPFGISWASPRIPDVSGMPTGRVRYERDYKNRSTPSAQTSLSPSKRPVDALLPHLGRPSNFTKKRERGRSHWRRLASRLKGRGFGFLITFSSLLSRYPNRGPRPIYMVNDWF